MSGLGFGVLMWCCDTIELSCLGDFCLFGAIGFKVAGDARGGFEAWIRTLRVCNPEAETLLARIYHYLHVSGS